MAFEPVGEAAVNSAVVDEFSFYVTIKADGRAYIEVSHGFNKPLIIGIGESAKFALSIPFNPQPQPMRLSAYKEGINT